MFKPMRVHTLQHVPFEGLAYIGDWLSHTSHQVSTSHLYNDDSLPQQEDFDALIIMGGPMGIYDDEQHPWLAQERAFIKQSIENNKPVLGVCLGSQFIADALGSKVYPNSQKEIVWFTLEKAKNAHSSAFSNAFPESFTALHWHGDTFDLPESASLLLSSEACKNQAFSFDDRVVALQFHLEMTENSTQAIVTACGDELMLSDTVQSAEQILSTKEHYPHLHATMAALLERLLGRA